MIKESYKRLTGIDAPEDMQGMIVLAFSPSAMKNWDLGFKEDVHNSIDEAIVVADLGMLKAGHINEVFQKYSGVGGCLNTKYADSENIAHTFSLFSMDEEHKEHITERVQTMPSNRSYHTKFHGPKHIAESMKRYASKFMPAPRDHIQSF